MWTLEKEFRFEASHVLPKHGGKCARLHGHSWRGKIICAGDILIGNGSSSGMLIDYDYLAEVIEPLLESHLDHYHLNDSLRLENPTTEEISRWVYDKVKSKISILKAVEIEETCTARCRYEPT
jgi:6-pyruvoyltetrahydropterin/6-carboxytetrahydropterin synthase